MFINCVVNCYQKYGILNCFKFVWSSNCSKYIHFHKFSFSCPSFSLFAKIIMIIKKIMIDHKCQQLLIIK